ncbi:MAG: hypothetical protein U0487_00665 [Patescibacteria group bacterium]
MRIPVTVDTSTPAGCSDLCIETVENGVVGKVASCGNRIVETTNGKYCLNSAGTGPCAVNSQGCRTTHGDTCTLLAPGSKGGEECDEVLIRLMLIANNLWKPMVSSQCGQQGIEPW